jgi:hypothetical protein
LAPPLGSFIFLGGFSNIRKIHYPLVLVPSTPKKWLVGVGEQCTKSINKSILLTWKVDKLTSLGANVNR